MQRVKGCVNPASSSLWDECNAIIVHYTGWQQKASLLAQDHGTVLVMSVFEIAAYDSYFNMILRCPSSTLMPAIVENRKYFTHHV